MVLTPTLEKSVISKEDFAIGSWKWTLYVASTSSMEKPSVSM